MIASEKGCINCFGSGVVLSKIFFQTYETCSVCGGTGQAPEKEEEEVKKDKTKVYWYGDNKEVYKKLKEEEEKENGDN